MRKPDFCSKAKQRVKICLLCLLHGWPSTVPLLLATNAPVICITGSPGAGDSGDIAGLKCLALTSDVSRQCRGFAGVMISRYTVTLIQIRF